MACVGQNVSAPQPTPAHRRPVWKPLAAAAVFVLLIGGIFGYRALDRSVCTVIVDINPSVTLTVNRLGRVKAMDTGNADADALLADIDLAGARTQDALDTLTDALTDADAWQVSPGKAALAETIPCRRSSTRRRRSAPCRCRICSYWPRHTRSCPTRAGFRPRRLPHHLHGERKTVFVLCRHPRRRSFLNKSSRTACQMTGRLRLRIGFWRAV